MELNEKLIDLVETFSCLYDTKSTDFKVTHKKENAIFLARPDEFHLLVGETLLVCAFSEVCFSPRLVFYVAFVVFVDKPAREARGHIDYERQRLTTAMTVSVLLF